MERGSARTIIGGGPTMAFQADNGVAVDFDITAPSVRPSGIELHPGHRALQLPQSCGPWEGAHTERTEPSASAAKKRILPRASMSWLGSARTRREGRKQAVDPTQVARALDGDHQAMQVLVEGLLPVVQTEVGYALVHGARIESRDPRQEVRDFVQEVFVQLLAKRGKVLRSWDPERGRSLDSFVRLVARRQVAAILRSGRRSPWADKPVAADELERERELIVSDAATVARVESAEQLERLLARLDERLDERGMLLFRMLYVEERSVEEVMQTTDMTRDAVYAWRSRFRKLVASLADPSEEG